MGDPGVVPQPDQSPASVPDILTRAAIAASPKFAGSLAILYEGFRDRWAERSNQVLEVVLSDIPAPELESRLLVNPDLEAALVAAMEIAGRSGLEDKRRLLGRVVKRAVLDDARVDEATLIVGILAQIDAPHVRCLEDVRRAEEQAEEAGEVSIRADLAEREIVQRIAEAGYAHPAPVLAAVTSLGLLETTGTWDGAAMVKGLTAFGQELLRDLRAT